MREFEIGDMIGYDSPEDGYIYGRIVGVTETSFDVEDLDDEWETFWVPKEKAEYIEPIIIDDETVKKFARYEICGKDVIGDAFPPQRIQEKEKYSLTIEDLIVVLKKANGMPAERFKEEWLKPYLYDLDGVFSYFHPVIYDAGTDGYRYLPSEGFFTWDAIDRIDNCIYDGENDYSEMIEELVNIQKLLRLPVPERQYDDGIKEYYIKSFDKGSMLERATNDELKLFVQYVEELCVKDNEAALYAKAYGCYGGNRAFLCDWVTSRECLLKLMEQDENPFLANTLGYIYYYGRCTNGEPEYEKAFKYFSIGAAGYVYESRYKLADMFRNGYGVPKNNKIASSMIWELYDENIKYMYKGQFDCKFADIALRAGNLFRDGIDCDAEPDAAYFYYLQAEFAIKMRMLEDDHYGDVKVADGIGSAIEEILPQTSYVKPKRTVNHYNLGCIISHRHKKHRLLEMKIKKLKNGEYSLCFRMVPKDGEKYPLKFFVTSPEAHFCGMLDTITAKTVNCTKIKINGRILKNDSATVVFDSIDFDDLCLYGKKVAEIVCNSYKVKYPSREKTVSAHFAAVVFSTGSHSYDYICNIPDVKVGDKVIVNTSQGETKVEVVRVFDKNSTETALPIEKYKEIIRKV